jgi:large subunit ribosomal protein L22
MATAHATSKYIRTSAQKAGLVLAQIRGAEVARALATLRFSTKLVARDIEKTLRSAIANVQQQESFGGDVDRLYVARCWADQGPSMKRTRPAPMGRAFRVVKRMAHLTVEVAERPRAAVASAPAPEGNRQERRAKRAPAAKR